MLLIIYILSIKVILIIYIYIINILWLKYISFFIPLLLSIAFLTLLERKVLSGIQRRRGPNLIGIYGLLQPISDGIKLFGKETIIPNFSNIFIFTLAPVLFFSLSLLSWTVIPFDAMIVIVDIELGIFYIFALSSLSTYGIIMSGWASNSKYAFLGSMRTVAQLISYEISIGLLIIPILLFTGSANISIIVEFQREIFFIFTFLPSFILFFISILAETNRIPFDLAEAESELVSGYNIEYSAIGFVFFFLGEYSNIILMSSLLVCLFLGGFLPIYNTHILTQIPGWFWFSFKLIAILFLFIWIRASLPRYRYDQLMFLGWKLILPLSLSILLYSFITIILFSA